MGPSGSAARDRIQGRIRQPAVAFALTALTAQSLS